MNTVGTKFLTGLVLAGVTGWSAIAGASVIDVNADADAPIKNTNGSNFGTLNKLIIVNSGGNRWKSYVRFQIDPSWVGNITDASLNLTISKTNSAREIGVIALTDETLDGWGEGTITAANAPGSVNADVTQTYTSAAYDLSVTDLLTSFVIPSSSTGQISIPLGTNGLSLLNADTNGMVTLMLASFSVSTANFEFSSREAVVGVDGTDPILSLTVIPEPSTGIATLLGGMALLGARRRRAKS